MENPPPPPDNGLAGTFSEAIPHNVATVGVWLYVTLVDTYQQTIAVIEEAATLHFAVTDRFTDEDFTQLEARMTEKGFDSVTLTLTRDDKRVTITVSSKPVH